MTITITTTKDTLASSFVRVFFIQERENSITFRVSKKEVNFLSFLLGPGGENTPQDTRHNYVWILPGVLLL